ncbi:guanylate-binding protein 1-like isoform X2 [Pseudophryne corroboree]|uniref:guanylate-binding protein 1-like isoform X2 n=1 Tax=Pseudophryne corroboree TaxID=495146 RepID=UPI00308183C3
MEAPLCLIENPENGKFRVNPEAIDVLSQISQPVVVVAIVGLYRTGKSDLMNKLAGAQREFKFGSNVQAKTKGIWMWCLPHPTKENHTLVLLDTEGLGDVEKEDTRNDTWIFCLANLLSSTFIYNSRGVIDEDAIEKLRYVGEMSKFIKVKTKNNNNEEAEFSTHFPNFIWTVRDFNLELNGEAITADAYLEKALRLQNDSNVQRNGIWWAAFGIRPPYLDLYNEGNNRKVRDCNNCRDCIRMYFKSRKCFVFGFSTGDGHILKRMDEDAFVAQTREFCDHIYETAEVKCLDKIHVVTGRVLGDLAQLYVESIGSSNVACIENVEVKISDAQNKAAVRNATQYYEAKMKERVVFLTETLDEFMELRRQCNNEALQIFLEMAFKDNMLLYLKEFLEYIEKKKSGFFEMNDRQSYKYCWKLIKKHSEYFETALKYDFDYGRGGYQKFKENLKLLKEKYFSEPHKGTQAEAVFLEFLNSKMTLGNTILMNDDDLNKQQKKQEEERMRKEKEEMKERMDEMKSSEEKLKSEEQKRTAQESFERLKEKIKADNEMKQIKLKFIIEQKKREMEAYKSEGYYTRARKYECQVTLLQKQRDELENLGWVVLLFTLIMGIYLSVPVGIAVVGGIIFGGIARLFSR